MSRYDTLADIITRHQPSSIVETGTWRGERAVQMATAALKQSQTVHYLGFDLFEDATPASDARELNVKKHANLREVQKRLESFAKQWPGFSFQIVKGDTRDTIDMIDLPDPLDFVFIDGGHSINTIASDWTSLMHASCLVLDDYYQPDGMGRRPDITRYGCNRLVDGLDSREWSVIIHSGDDKVMSGGLVALAEVQRK